MSNFLGYMVCSVNNDFEYDLVEIMKGNFKRSAGSVVTIEVVSDYFHEKCLVFSDAYVSPEEALQWFEQIQTEFYDNDY